MARIELKGLRKVFGRNIEAVKNLDFTIEEGEFVVIVGPSGCGKTTTLRMVAGFEEPTAGEITIDGRLVNDVDPGDRGVGMVFQTHALFPHKTIAENIEFGPRMKKVPEETRKQKVREVADMVRITHLLQKLPVECSGGEAQRAALARTLITDPSAFLLDEPLSSLDAKLRREMRAEVDRLHQELKQDLRLRHPRPGRGDDAGRPHRGDARRARSSRWARRWRSTATRSRYFVADFFGSPSMNLIPGTDRELEAGTAVFAGAAHRRSRCPGAFAGAQLPAPSTRSASGPSIVAVGSRGSEPGRATIHLVEPLGKDTLLYFEHGAERPTIAVVEASDRFKAGERLNVTFDPARVYLFEPDGTRVR